jgi:hypothetical protein
MDKKKKIKKPQNPVFDTIICVSGESFTGMRNYTNFGKRKELASLFYGRAS